MPGQDAVVTQVRNILEEYADNPGDFSVIQTAQEIIDKVIEAKRQTIRKDLVNELRTTLNDYLEEQ
jgi:hypothetical protein